VGTSTFTQVPDSDIAPTICTDKFALIGVYDHIIDRVRMLVVSLDCSRPGVPHLHRLIFGAGNHPLPFAVECDAGNIVGVTFEGHDRIGVRGLDIVQSDDMAASSSEKFLVGSDAEPVYLGFRVLNGTGANARESLPETSRRC
jgi:hypothetical protein